MDLVIDDVAQIADGGKCVAVTDIDDQYRQLRDDLVCYLSNGGALAIVKAPPGSGKTQTLIDVLAGLVSDGARVAVAAQTNSQADDICVRLAAAYPTVNITRFSSAAGRVPDDFPDAVDWVTDKADLPGTAGVTVATTAKWSLTDMPDDLGPYDLLAIDEAWQMSSADLMQCATVSGRFLMIGDPGQILPVVTIDVARWETSPRAPHWAAPDVVIARHELDAIRFVGSLPACRRLPHEAIDFVLPFYDFEFVPYRAPGTSGIDLPDGHHWQKHLSSGLPLALTIPTPETGPPIEVDKELATAAARIVDGLASGGATVRIDGRPRPLTRADIGVTSSHQVMNSAIIDAIGPRANEIRVDTPERWQGLQRPVMIVVHPLSGVVDPSAFDLETGRLCVMVSRHQAALIVITRDHIGDTLRDYVPSSSQAPGRPDVVGRGHDAYLKFWERLETAGAVAAL